MRWWEMEEFDDCDVFDPVRVERSPKVEDSEAAVFEAICHSASPGPFVIDDHADGEGIAVASLPDGRLIVSLGVPQVSEEDSEIQAEANARLFCESRCMILRLLRDRERWYEREQDMLNRIAILESRLAKIERHHAPHDRLDSGHHFPR